MTTKSRLFLVSPLFLVLLVGCNNARTAADVSGSVKYKGAPVTGGTIAFYPASGGSYSTPISPDGTYTISGLPPGDAKVTVETESVKRSAAGPTYGGNKGGKTGQQMSPIPEGFAPPEKGKYVKIPSKYAKPDTSGLTVTVTGGKVTKDFDLTD